MPVVEKDLRMMFIASLVLHPEFYQNISPLKEKSLEVLFGENSSIIKKLNEGNVDYNTLRIASMLSDTDVMSNSVSIKMDFEALCQDLFAEGRAIWEQEQARKISELPLVEVFDYQRTIAELREFIWSESERKDAAQEALSKIRNLRAGKSTAIITGNKVVDTLIYAEQGEIITIGAESGIGKTTLLLEFLYVYIKSGANVLFNSMEIDIKDAYIKMGCQVNEFNFKDTMKANLSNEEYDRLELFIDEISNSDNFHICSETTLDGLSQKINSTGARIVANDFVNMMRGCSTTEGMELTQYRLKEIAKSFGVTMINLVQLNKSTGMNAGKMPTIHNIKGSAATREVSTEVLLLYREGFYFFNEDGSPVSDQFKITMAKSRYGEMYVYTLQWKKTGIPDIYSGWYNESYDVIANDVQARDITEPATSITIRTNDDDIGDVPF